MIEVPCFSLTGLLARLPEMVDLVHCDIQGSEADVISASMEMLSKKVRRIVVGTHSRSVEGTLIDVLSAHGWRLEHEDVCRYQQESSGKMALTLDGVQVWRNPAI